MQKNGRKISMRKIREVLRLRASGLSQHQISRSLRLSVGAVNKYIKLANQAGLSWPLSEEMNDQDIGQKLSAKQKSCKIYTAPDFDWIKQELSHKGVTLQLLHEEYCQQYPESHYSYRQFCALYYEWKKSKKLSLRQEHKGGDKMFIDYAGQTIPIVVDRKTGKTQSAQIYVAILAASNYTYSEATWTQSCENWIGSNTRSFSYFKGVPSLLVPDNLRSAVSKACRYEPDINQSYGDMVRYYDTAVLPARPYKPKDKSKVENAVLVVERWILARLRHQTFYSLGELNCAIKNLLEDLNNRPFQKMEGSRKSLFEKLDLPSLKPLPEKPFEYAQYYHQKVTPDYHIHFEQHFYSVPHTYVSQKVEIRVTEKVIEILCEGKRIASHVRNQSPGKSTVADHMPKSHQKYLEWSFERCLQWAKKIGPSTNGLIKTLMKKAAHPDQAKRSGLGLLRLEKHFGRERLEAACHRALHYGLLSYKHVARILENNLDRENLEDASSTPVSQAHPNVRGSNYYR